MIPCRFCCPGLSLSDWNLLTCSESDRRQDLLACVPPSPGHSEGICSMNLIFRRCSIGILSGAAASTALTATPHHALWNFGGQHGEQDRYVELRRFLRLHWQYRA